MTNAQTIAYRLRWLILIVGLLCLLAGIVSIFGPVFGSYFGIYAAPWFYVFMMLDWPFANEEQNYGLDMLVFVGVFFLTQWLFLRPRRGWTFKLAATGRPMRLSVIAAACMAMMLTTAFLTTLLELPNWWPEPVVEPFPIGGREVPTFFAVWFFMLLLWAIWALVFFIYWRQGDRYTQLGRMIRGLIAGSVLELFVATGVYVWNPHKEDCYCARGSYTGLVFGGTVLLWAFGPGIILLFLREKYRRQKFNLCNRCGYDLRGTLAAGRTECPECGAGIERGASQPPLDSA